VDKLKKGGSWLLAAIGSLLVVWAIAIGPVSVWRVVTHGTTTVWDHLEYPGRQLFANPNSSPWEVDDEAAAIEEVSIDGTDADLHQLLAETGTLGWVVARSGVIVDEWYGADHGPAETSMLFSVTKSVTSLLIGAGVEQGLIDSVDDPVTRYLPELEPGGAESVSIEDLLRMDSGLDYVEDDNPFGQHVEFNYTPDLTGQILDLRFDDEPDPQFRYKSGDNAMLGLILDRVLGDVTITEYLQRTIWDPLGLESDGTWSTDSVDGLERTWCCLAMTARDLARIGVMVGSGGVWQGRAVIPEEWVSRSAEPAYTASRWPAEYEGSPLANYGYQWWITESGAILALGKAGQYLYVGDEIVIVRLGETQGDVSWTRLFEQLASVEHG
jgi:CubicO group peptidase (beta-lactamase class C family)